MNKKESDKNLYLPSMTDVGNNVSDVDVIASKVVFEKNGFVIFYCNGNFSVKGNFAGTVVSGLRYKVSGLVGLYGRILQITANSIELVEDDNANDAVIASFLRNNFDGIGDKTSLGMAKEYGENILEELLKRPKTVAKSVAGLSEKRALSMSDKITEGKDYLTQILKMRILGVSEDHAKKAYDMFGMACASEIDRNPYLLLRINGVGFDTCEYIARNKDIDRFDRMRLLGAILSVLNDIHYSSGNTYISKNELKAGVSSLIFDKANNACDTCTDRITCDLNPNNCSNFDKGFADAVLFGVNNDDIVVYHFEDGKCSGCGLNSEDARIAIKRIFKIEAGIKREIESFVSATKPEFDYDLASNIIERLSLSRCISLDELQKEALMMCMREPFSVITGGPGTGKTTITGILASHFKEKKISCLFCAPTGRAAKRLSESIDQDAHTIHRLLEVRPSELDEGFVFGKNQNNQLDARVVVVDEASMVDNALFYALLKAIKPDSSLILIGDPNQLPSVGPGNLLADLLSCKSVPRVELKYVFRQKDESSIAANAYRILNGEELISNDTDFNIINVISEDEAVNNVFECFDKYKDTDMVILSPTKQNVMGTISLNKEIQGIAARIGAESLSVGTSSVYREYDKVMQIKNDYNIQFFDESTNEVSTGVYNGEIGEITKISEINKTIEVVFDDGKKVLYEGKTLEDIDLAYAMTVHKAQGCEFDTVVIALGKMSYHLLNRKLLYTAVTRGKKKVIIINFNNALKRMIKSVDVNKRQTSLTDFVQIIDKKRGI